MGLPPSILSACTDMNFVSPTEIQELTIPWLMENDGDLIALAQTGTGKTAAFGFPILSKTDSNRKVIQSLILCPTRELCLQIARDLDEYSKFIPNLKTCAVYGGAPMFKQKEQLNRGSQIVVGTPGRVFDFLKQGVLKLENIQSLVLDEADEMLNMGFKEELFGIMDFCPKDKQTMLFSATMPNDVATLAKTFMANPHRISAGKQNQGAENIEHFYYKVHAKDKYKALKRIADMSPNIYGIIFCRTRNETQEIADKLQHDGYNADALHGDLSQGQRELVMSRFRSKYVRLLVATDVAARGLDVDDLTHIINYNAPTETDVYIHRSGRTGRAGKSGISIIIVHSKEMSQLKAIENRLGREITYAHVPNGREICEIQLLNFIDTVENVEVDETQVNSFLDVVYTKLESLSKEEVIKRFVSVEFNRFLTYYKDALDLDLTRETKVKPLQQHMDYIFAAFKLNIGAQHGLTKRDLMRHVNRLKITAGIEIGHIEIMSDHSIMELDSEYQDQALKLLNKSNYRGQNIVAKVLIPKDDAPDRRRYEKKPSEQPWNRKAESKSTDKPWERKSAKKPSDQPWEKRSRAPKKNYRKDK